MSKDQSRLKIVYSEDSFYHVFASSDIEADTNILMKLNSSQSKRFEKIDGRIVAMEKIRINDCNPCGLVTFSHFPKNEKNPFLHVFVKNGNAMDAVNKAVQLLDEKNFPQKHLDIVIVY
ncbi:MAG: hypothetical protein IKO48_08115 [Elusimicrobia bacterium]|nr:hypothetical protein [Elusimicrobiota bacterium]MBR6125669.1 hypothetical protein [Candidatus Saccharibacteria bacterium]